MYAVILITTRWHHTSFLPIFSSKLAVLEKKNVFFRVKKKKGRKKRKRKNERSQGIFFATRIEHLLVSLHIGEGVYT